MRQLNNTRGFKSLIKQIKASDTIPLRSLVLRPGRPISTCLFDGDDLASSFHFGYYQGKNCLGIASFIQTQINIYQLRGMATHPDNSGKGIGSSILNFAEGIFRDKNIESIWCNARSSAESFYLKHGFIAVGEYFEIPKIGTHIKMKKTL